MSWTSPVEQITATMSGVFETLAPLLAEASRLFADRAPARASLAAIDPLAQEALQRPDDMVVGAGLVAARGVVSDAEYWLQWWSDYDTPRTHVPQQLSVEVDPRSETFNDYTELPWFRAPQATGQRHVTGPYVDYLCTDEYTLTFTVPVRGHSGFAGVVGADVYARAMVDALQPILARLEGPAAVVNSAGRIIAASGSEHETGDMVRDPGLGAALHTMSAKPDARIVFDGGELVRCSDLQLAVVTGPAVST